MGLSDMQHRITVNKIKLKACDIWAFLKFDRRQVKKISNRDMLFFYSILLKSTCDIPPPFYPSTSPVFLFYCFNIVTNNHGVIAFLEKSNHLKESNGDNIIGLADCSNGDHWGPGYEVLPLQIGGGGQFWGSFHTKA